MCQKTSRFQFKGTRNPLICYMPCNERSKKAFCLDAQATVIIHEISQRAMHTYRQSLPQLPSAKHQQYIEEMPSCNIET